MEKEIIILDYNQLERISQLLGEELTGSQITEIFHRINACDNSGLSTKWRRIYYVFSEQKRNFNSNTLAIRFIGEVLQPARYASNNVGFENLRTNINLLIAFSGYEYDETGKLKKLEKKASTITEAQFRVKSLKAKLENNNIHNRVLSYCKEELLQENYFHVIFESTKSLADEVRTKTGLKEDGGRLFEKAFSITAPYLLLNNLQTESEKNRQIGLCKLLCGVYSYFRNVEAHEPHIKWLVNEDDAVNALQIISFLHYQLDLCIICRYEN